jgi:hypothetical protein
VSVEGVKHLQPGGEVPDTFNGTTVEVPALKALKALKVPLKGAG